MCQAWANPSAVKHTPLEQQLYVSKALLLSVSLLKDSELQELRSGTMLAAYWFKTRLNKVTSISKQRLCELKVSCYLPLSLFFPLRLTSVFVERHAKPPGQQCGAHQAYGHGGGRVPQLSHGYQWNKAQI